jgi:hypothetical protein
MEYTTEQVNALAVIVMLKSMPIKQRAKCVNVVSYTSEIFDELVCKGSLEMRANDVWTGRIRNLEAGGKQEVKKVLEACGVKFTGGNRASGPLVATLEKGKEENNGKSSGYSDDGKR